MIIRFNKKVIYFLAIFFVFQTNIKADSPYFVDFKFILNNSKAGGDAQKYLKKKLTDGFKKIKDKEKSIQKEEQVIITQKKVLNAEEYKKKVTDLRNKVSNLQKERNTLLDEVAKQRSKARSELLKALNPIMSNYMKEKNIRMIVDKKSILLADENLDLTKEIVDILNKNLKAIKLN
tara:strand:- start:1727 stop:2257 length:531 start_codon:yes stop_codon:yes gene_type:complete